MSLGGKKGTYYKDGELRTRRGGGRFPNIYGQASENDSAHCGRENDVSLTVLVRRREILV